MTERSINETRELYRPAAVRGAVLFFVVADMAVISPMYQYSLSYFTRLFVHCIDASPVSDNVADRLDNLNTFTTQYLFENVQRGLFEDHKTIFSFLICTSILRRSPCQEITEKEWSLFTRGDVADA